MQLGHFKSYPIIVISTTFRQVAHENETNLKNLYISHLGRFPLRTKPMLKSLSYISKTGWSPRKQNQYWNHFHVFYKINVEITFMYFIKSMLKSLSCISQIGWSSGNKINVEITFMYFTKPMLKSLLFISQIDRSLRK